MTQVLIGWMVSINSNRKIDDNQLNKIAAMGLEVSCDMEESVSELAFA
jgi:hypothetical protein